MPSFVTKSKLIDLLSSPKPEFALFLALIILLTTPLYIARNYENLDEIMTVFLALLVVGLVWKFVNLHRTASLKAPKGCLSNSD